MDWIVVILAGAVIGWIASIIMHTNAQMGAIANIICGLVGAVIGRFIASALHMSPAGTNFSIPGLVFGVIGACVLIGIVKLITGGAGRTTV
ncbi:hypothetical protein IAD21_05943 [Abditibacteriota bacterium]|nr:hypothetical protein IAD21_05943 [Abditibacteriota bacterium]